jgi:lysine-specific demethylase 8
MSQYLGPEFQFVETIEWDELQKQGGFQPRGLPLLVKGAVKQWPAWDRWTFENLAQLKRPDGSEVVTSFQNGLVEQGVTRQPLIQPVAPYLRELAERAKTYQRERRDDIGLLPDRRRHTLGKGDTFHLDWDYMQSFVHDRAYLAQWYILNEFPALRQDFAIRSLWSGLRWTWEYVFIGPANTVTGVHYDFPNNWFCQPRGTKEFLLFPPENDPYMSKSLKYDWGATLSDVNISELPRQPEIAARFAKAKGLYARVEAGDALFVPKRTWHAVVSLEPSISLAVFGLTIPEILFNGGASETRSLMHKLHLYRWGNCTCHKMDGARLAVEMAE